MPFCSANASFAQYSGTFLGTDGLTCICCSQALACGGGGRADALRRAGQAIGDVGNLRRVGLGVEADIWQHMDKKKRNRPCTC